MTGRSAESGGVDQLLAGKVAVVSGSGYGIGRAIVEEVVGLGAAVVCADIDERAAALAVDLAAAGHRVVHHYVDLRDDKSINDLFEFVDAQFGRIDILVNNAAAPRSARPFLELETTEWDLNMAINARGTFLAMQSAGRRMASRGEGGRIINISTVAAMRPFAERAHYGASKGVVLTLTRCAALELAQYGITVNAISPGPVDTEQSRAARAGGNSDSDGEVLTAIFSGIPIGRMGLPKDIAHAVGFLALPSSDFITGTVIPVDGGMYIRS